MPITKSINSFPVVGIGASAGGLDAFKKLLKAIPEDSGMAYVLVQHLHPDHESVLTEILQKATKIPVVEIKDDIKVQPNHVYIIPANKMMIANDGVLLLSPRKAAKEEPNLVIDLFFNSLAEVHQSHSIGVVLSGTGTDATKGLKAIKDYGGITIAQDTESAAYGGMPQSAIQAGVVDFILPPEMIPQKLLEITKIAKLNDSAEEQPILENEESFKQILVLLRIRKGTDFTYYKKSTLQRRILRRMLLNKQETPAEYLNFLRENKSEQDVLYLDLLIPVTSFFRDPKTFENLCDTVFPEIIKKKKENDSLRIWIAGCSTGQEVYSMAICLKEFLGERTERVQIFATDISEPAIIKARRGMYTKSEVDGMSAKRLQQYFVKNNGSYQLTRQVRDMCVFAVHNFLKDPPFSKLDLISCRNVLIYMEPYLQKKALTTFHYALNHHGFLLLGKSETISGAPELFGIAQKGDKLFNRKNAASKSMHIPGNDGEIRAAIVHENQKNNAENSRRPDFQKTAEDIMLRKFTPAGVVVNEAMDVVHFMGKTGDYFELFPGKPSHNLLKMAKEGLAFELRNILHKAKKEKQPAIQENIPLQTNGIQRNIAIEAILLQGTIEPYYLIVFHEIQPIAISFHPIAVTQQTSITTPQPATKRKAAADSQQLVMATNRIQQLEKELLQAREDMRSITEDQEALNEELQSTNEELLSSSEELQSLNEELETGKEELQSSNEELTVVNQEIIGLNEQVTESKNYAETIIATLREPLLVLDKNLRVKSANKSFYSAFQVKEAETEGKLIYHLGDDQWNIAELRILLENVLPKKQSFSDFEVSFNFPHLGERIMQLNASEIINEKGDDKLILISFGDITERRIVEKRILTNEERFRNLLLQSPFCIALCKGENMVIDLANDAMKDVWGKGKDVEGKSVFDLLDDISTMEYNKILLDVYQTGRPYVGIEQLALLERNGTLADTYFNFTYQPYREADGSISGIVSIAYEVTQQVLAKRKVEASEQQFSTMADNIPQLAWMADEKGSIYWYNKRWYDYTGANLEEMQGWGWQKVHHPDHVDKVINFVKKAWEVNEPFELTFPLLGADGEYRWFLTRAQPIADANGTILRWFGTNTDITEQREIQSLLEYRKALLEAHNEASIDGILLVDAKGKIISYNKIFQEIWNMPQDIVAAKDDNAALNFAMNQLVNPQQFIEKVQWLYDNPTETSVDELEFKDGKIVERHGYPVIADDGSYYAWSWTFRDITEQRKTEKIIEESEERFRNVANSAPVLIWMADTDKLCYFFNKGWLNFTGRTVEQERGNGWAEGVHPDDLQKCLDIYFSSFDKREPFYMEYRLKRHDGEYRWLSDNGVPRFTLGGVFEGYIGACMDINNERVHHQALEESEKRFRLLADSVPQHVWTADVEGNLNYYNQSVFDYSGLSVEQIHKDGWLQIVHPDDREENIKKWVEAITNGTDFLFEHRFKKYDGEYRWQLSRAVPQKDAEGNITMWVGSSTDIQMIKEEEQRKGEFIKMVSHELKTPVTSIKGYVQMLLSMLKEEKEGQKSALPLTSSLQRIDIQIARLTRLITEILDVSRLEESKLDLKKEIFVLNELAIETVQDIQFTNNSHSIIVKQNFTASVYGDKDRIQQVIINLINNSIQYSPEKTSIELSINKAGNRIAVSVKDFGIGIAKNHLEKIFERFYRVSGKNEDTFSGFGIGLYIANEIIKRHEGDLKAESELENGSIFTFTLPVI